MQYLVYTIENNGEERLIAECDTYDGARSIVDNSPSIFINGYRIYEKVLLEGIYKDFKVTC